MSQAIITKIFRFDSAHKLEDHPGKCKDLHGHSWELHVSIKGPIKEDGMVLDFKRLKSTVKDRVLTHLDHKYLNDIIPNPTAENISVWIWGQLKEELPLHEIKLYETPTSYVTYRGP